jgi:hypothetical protein
VLKDWEAHSQWITDLPESIETLPKRAMNRSSRVREATADARYKLVPFGTPTIQSTYKNQPSEIRVHWGPISYWIVGVIGRDSEMSARISFATLA